MAKSKVNLRFILILIVAGGFATVILGGLWFVQARKNPTRNLQAAKQFLAEGNKDDALKQMQRVVIKVPEQLEYVDQTQELLLSMRPDTRDRARELYNLHLALLQHEANYRPSDIEVQLNLVRELMDCAKFVQQGAVWQAVIDASRDIDNRFPSSDPNHAYGRLYRGFSRIQLRETLSEQDVVSALEDIRAFTAAHPNSDLGWGMLLTAQLQIYGDYQRRSESRRAEEKLREFDVDLRTAIQNVPDGLDVTKCQVMRLAEEYSRLSIAGAPQAARDAANEAALATAHRLTAAAEKSKDLMLVAEVATLLWRMNTPDTIAMARNLVRPIVQAQPERLDFHILLGQFTYSLVQFTNSTDDLTEGETICRAVKDCPPLPVGYLSRFQHEIQTRAASLIVDIAYRRWELTPASDLALRAQHLAKIQEARDDLKAIFGDQEPGPVMYRADGKLAFAKGEVGLAASRFEEILKRPGAEQDYEMLIFSALSLDRLGEKNFALERANAAQALPGANRNIGLMVIRAQLMESLRMWDDASRLAQDVLDILKKAETPDPITAAMAQAVIDNVKLKQERLRPQPQAPEDPVRALSERVEALLKAEKADEARALLAQARSQFPEDPRIPFMQINVERRLENLDQARQFFEGFKAGFPTHPAIAQLDIELSSSDPIERIERSVESRFGAENDRAVFKLIALMNVVHGQARTAEALEKEGKTEEAAKARDLGVRANARVKALEQANPEALKHPALLDARFNLAIEQKDYAAAEALLADLTAGDVDQCGGLIYRGRLEIERKQAEQAVRTLTDATARRNFSSHAWRLLGVAYHQAGNIREARRALEESYRRNSNDISTVKLLFPVLLELGDEVRALTVLRDGFQLAPSDPMIREYWLVLEEKLGDINQVLARRTEVYRLRPDDHGNAIALATLLVERDPSRENVIDPVTKSIKYAPDVWSTLPAAEKERLLNQTKLDWISYSAHIVNELQNSGLSGLQLAVIRARLHRAQGNPELGDEVLRNYIASLPKEEVTIDLHLALAEYQHQGGRIGPAIKTLEDARPLQDPKLRQADKVIGDIYFSRGSQFAQAYEAYSRVMETNPDRTIRIRVIESLIQLKRFDEAEAALAKLETQGSRDVVKTMLSASIHEGRSDAHYASGRAAEGDAELAKVKELLQQARQMETESPLPPLSEARLLAKQYRRDPEHDPVTAANVGQLLEEARRLGADLAAISAVRVEICLAAGDRKCAIGELKRLIAMLPGSLQARRQLIGLYVSEKEYAAAIEVVKETIEFNPTNPVWYLDLGELYERAGGVNEAIAAYAKAHSMRPEAASARRLAAAMLKSRDRDFSGVVTLINSRPEFLEDAVLAGLLAQAQAGLGMHHDAMEQIGRAYGLYRKAIADGAEQREISGWFASAKLVWNPGQPAMFEEQFMKLAGSDLTTAEYHELARIWVASGEQGMPRAVELMDMAAAKLPPGDDRYRAFVYYDLGAYRINTGDLVNGAKALEEVVRLDPSNGIAHNDLAFILATKLSDPSRALPLAQRAVELMPNNPDALDTLGLVHLLLQQCQEAETHLRKAYTMYKPPTAVVTLHLAQALHCMGSTTQAKTFLKRALELNPPADIKLEIQQLQDQLSGSPR